MGGGCFWEAVIGWTGGGAFVGLSDCVRDEDGETMSPTRGRALTMVISGLAPLCVACVCVCMCVCVCVCVCICVRL